VRVALAVNPTAGRGRGARAGELAVRSLIAAGIEVDLLRGSDAADLAGRITDGLDRGAEALVVVGGDGIVNLGVNAVAGTAVPLGIVPAGTGNDVALGLGLPVGDPSRGIELLRRDLTAGCPPRQVDAVRCSGAGPQRWFAGVLGAGFDAIVNERANGWSRPRGRLRYVLAIARELPVFRPRNYIIDLDGERWETAAMLVAVGNACSYGGGMRVVPDARMDDGMLDVLVLEPVSRVEFTRIFPRVYSGRHVSHPRVVVRRARTVRVEAEGIIGYADGERFGPLPLSCEVVAGAVHVVASGMAPAAGG
jgi:diacylglycerol kinase (ATP)